MQAALKVKEVLRDAQDALRQGDWVEGRAGFEAAIALEETPEAYDGLATCCRFIGALDESLAARERAFRLFRERGDNAGAVVAAAWLGRDSGLPRAETSVARAWFAVARRLAAKTDSIRALGTLDYYEGQFALLGEMDAPRAGDLGARARSAGSECGDLDLEMQGLSLQGVAHVAEGRVDEGMALVEEAAAAVLGDELSGADVAGWICCHVIYACESVSDTRRATEWCATMRGFCERWDMPGMFGLCRAHHGSVLVAEGRWQEAEDEFVESTRLFATAAPALLYEATIRLCELRLRQGRLDEVTMLCEFFTDFPISWLALPYQAAVAANSGEPAAALAMLQRYLRTVPERDRMSRVAPLELKVVLSLETGAAQDAAAAADELAALAQSAGTERVRGAAALARGRVLAATGDIVGARTAMEDAVDVYSRGTAPFEAACARASLGSVLLDLGERAQALIELRSAHRAFDELGAAGETARVAALLDRTETAGAQDQSGLSERELEVLRLAAEGLSNNAIAERLTLSAHTVHRHMANIRTKLGGESKAAVVARAARDGLI